jgi:hypothetical protein
MNSLQRLLRALLTLVSGIILTLFVLRLLPAGSETRAGASEHMLHIPIAVQPTGQGQPQINVDPLQLQFGVVLSGSVVVDSIDLWNSGSADLVILSALPGLSAYNMVTATFPLSVATGMTRSILIAFSPQISGAQDAALTIISNDPDEVTTTVQLYGRGFYTSTAPADIDVFPTALNMGIVPVGASVIATVTLQNVGGQDLLIQSLGAPHADFTVLGPATPLQIPPAGSAIASIQFSPSVSGSANTDLQVASNDPDQALLLVPLSGTGTAQTGGFGFVDVTNLLNVGDTAHRHFGITVVDINNDGWVDLYYPNGLNNPGVPVPPSGTCPDLSGSIPGISSASRNTLFLNNGDGTFGSDTAPAAGIDDFWFAMRHAWGDYDNDGMKDLLSHNFLVSPIYQAISLSPLQYQDVMTTTETNICLLKGTGASWVDANNDGFLDIYAVEYDPNRLAVDHVNYFLINDGDGTFTEVTAAVGMDLPDNPMGVTFVDYDNDGDQDVYVSNSHEAPSRLYRNEGNDGITGYPIFVDVGAAAGVDVLAGPGRGFGVAWGDYDNDGRMDLLYSRETDSRLFHNEGPNGGGIWTFTDVTDLNGLAFSGKLFKDGNFGDLNNDGWLDILMAADGQANQVFLNNGDGSWTEVAADLGMELSADSSLGVVPADINNDGDLDVVWFSWNFGAPNYVFENTLDESQWIQFRLFGTLSNRDAVGARITITTEISPGQTVQQIREVTAGTGFFSDMPRIQTFGLGAATEATNVRVRWPSGVIQNLGTLSANQRHDVVEPNSLSQTAPSTEPRIGYWAPFLTIVFVVVAAGSRRARPASLSKMPR